MVAWFSQKCNEHFETKTSNSNGFFILIGMRDSDTLKRSDSGIQPPHLKYLNNEAQSITESQMSSGFH